MQEWPPWEGARLESSAVKYTLSLVSPPPDVCGSVVTKIHYGKMAKRIRILSSLWWEEDAPSMGLFDLCFSLKNQKLCAKSPFAGVFAGLA